MMLLTPDQAKTKECRVGGQVRVVAEDLGRGDVIYKQEFPRCAADGCAHWQWRISHRLVSSKIGNHTGVKTEEIREYGYCGLAGRPEETDR